MDSALEKLQTEEPQTQTSLHRLSEEPSKLMDREKEWRDRKGHFLVNMLGDALLIKGYSAQTWVRRKYTELNPAWSRRHWNPLKTYYHVYIHVHMGTHVCMSERQKTNSDVLQPLYNFSIFFKTGSFISLELVNYARQATREPQKYTCLCLSNFP